MNELAIYNINLPSVDDVEMIERLFPKVADLLYLEFSEKLNRSEFSAIKARIQTCFDKDKTLVNFVYFIT